MFLSIFLTVYCVNVHALMKAVILFSHFKTRMHFSRMRTAHSLPYRGVSLTETPWTENPHTHREPLDRYPPVDRHALVKT